MNVLTFVLLITMLDTGYNHILRQIHEFRALLAVEGPGIAGATPAMA